MKLVLSTNDNKYKINFDGGMIVTPSKFGVTKTRTLGGRLKVRWRNEYSRISVNISYLSEENYKTLKYIWSNAQKEILLHGENTTYAGIIVDESLDLKPQRDSEGDIFYSGSINIEE